jgi:hypothetical protein
MHGKQCAMCDRENCGMSDTLHDWCINCELEFRRVMQLVNCASRTNQCDSPISCFSAKKCLQVRAALITSTRVYETRERLRKCRERNFLGVIAAHTKIPEYALRDWVDKPSHFLSQKEMILVIEALDRYVPQQSATEGASPL